MGTGRILTLSRAQAEQLIQACAAFRSHAWHTLPPSPERNQAMRAAQAVQGRLAEQRAGADPLCFALTEKERQALRVVMLILIQAYGTHTPSEDRDRVLGKLYALRVMIERRGHQATTL